MEKSEIAKASHDEARPLAGRVIGVTGGARGLGRATVLLLARRGARVYAMDQSQEWLDDLAGKVPESVVLEQGDVVDPDYQARVIDRIQREQGVVHGWVNNAGINLLNSIENQSVDEFRRVMEVNVIAPWSLVKGLLPLMPEGAAIVNIASVMSERTAPKQVAYCTSKGAVESFTRSLAVELAPRRIRVNAIRPGYIPVEPYGAVGGKEAETRQIHREVMSESFAPLRERPCPEHIATVAAFLLGPDSAFMSGSLLTVDGGYSADVSSLLDPRRQEASRKLAEAGVKEKPARE